MVYHRWDASNFTATYLSIDDRGQLRIDHKTFVRGFAKNAPHHELDNDDGDFDPGRRLRFGTSINDDGLEIFVNRDRTMSVLLDDLRPVPGNLMFCADFPLELPVTPVPFVAELDRIRVE